VNFEKGVPEMPKPAKRTKNKHHVKRIKRKKKMIKAKAKGRKSK